MVRKQEDVPVKYKCIRGGVGEAEMHVLLNGEPEMYGKGRMFNHIYLAPGNSIGDHTHEGDNEIYYILAGTGTYNDNGTVVTVKAGDVTVCSDGETHGLINTGSEPMQVIALILY